MVIRYIVMLWLVLMLAACGSDSSDDSQPTGQQPPATDDADDDQDEGDGDDEDEDNESNALLTFDVAGSRTLHTLDEVASWTRSDASGLRTQAAYAGLADEPNDASGSDIITNLIASYDDGHVEVALDSPYPVKISQVVLSYDGEHVYAAFDHGDDEEVNYSTIMAALNCGIVKISLADNEYECVAEGVEVLRRDANEWAMTFGGSFTSMVEDAAGNVYFSGSRFTRECGEDCWMVERDAHAQIWKLSADSGELEQLTDDIDTLLSFQVNADGVLVFYTIDYRVEHNDNFELVMYREGELYPVEGSERAMKYVLSDDGTLLFDTDRDRYIHVKRLNEDGDFEYTKFSTLVFGGEEEYTHNNSRLARFIQGHDGNLYGLFWDELLISEPTHDDGGPEYGQALGVYQMLPYDPEPLTLDLLPDGIDSTEIERYVAPLVGENYLFYVTYAESEDYDVVHQVNALNLETRQQRAVLVENIDSLAMQLANWLVHGNTLYFSGLNQATDEVVYGELDATSLFAEDESDALQISVVESSSDARSMVRASEVLVVPPRLIDSGETPELEFKTNPSNPYSVSLVFSSSMEHASVIENVRVIEESGAEIPFIPVWLERSLHLFLDNSQHPFVGNASPLTPAARYQVELLRGAVDRWQRALEPEVSELFMVDPDRGWVMQSHTAEGTVVEGVSEGGYAMYIAMPDEYEGAARNMRFEMLDHDEARLQVPGDFRVQFSVRKLWWGYARLYLQRNDDTNEMVFEVNDHGVNVSYLTEHNAEGFTGGGVESDDLYDGSWRTFRFDVVGSNVTAAYSDDGENFTELNLVVSHLGSGIEDVRARDGADEFSLHWQQPHRFTLDKFELRALHADGSEGDVVYEQDFNALDTEGLTRIFVESPREGLTPCMHGETC